MRQRTFPISQLAIVYGYTYPKSSESDWIREVVLSLIGIWSSHGKIVYEDAMVYLMSVEEEQGVNAGRRRHLRWLRETIRKACRNNSC